MRKARSAVVKSPATAILLGQQVLQAVIGPYVWRRVWRIIDRWLVTRIGSGSLDSLPFRVITRNVARRVFVTIVDWGDEIWLGSFPATTD